MSLKKYVIAIFLVLLLTAPVFSQGIFIQSSLSSSLQNYTYLSQLNLSSSSEMPDGDKCAIIANGSSIYPVTPGDVYTLSYYNGDKIVEETLIVDSDSSVSITEIGKINGQDKKFNDFKKEVESRVTTFYPYGSPKLVIKSCGIFTVRVFGNVTNSGYTYCWGLSRLSDLSSFAQNDSSTRKVTLVDKNGKGKNYDLYNGVVTVWKATTRF